MISRTVILCSILSLVLIQESYLYDYVGCYTHPSQSVILLIQANDDNLTIQGCLTFCRRPRVTYAALQGGTNCSCLDKVNAIAQGSGCNIGCTGDTLQICGGTGSNYSVYTFCPAGKYAENCTNGCNNCANNERCNFYNGACPSGCKTGWTGQNCNIDIDECSANKAACNSSNSICVNTAGTYRCNCTEGYTSINTKVCTDVNECQTGSARCLSATKCINSDGGFSCECLGGYERKPDKACSDIDECALSDRVCNASTSTCSNTRGSYQCHCNPGYKSINSNAKLCVDIDECKTEEADCDNTTTNCFNTDGGYSCICRSGHEQANAYRCEKIVESSRSNRDALIAGAFVGALVGVILIAVLGLLLLIYWKRRKHVNREQPSVSSGSTNESSTNTNPYQTLDQATRDRKSSTTYTQLNTLTLLPVPPPKTKTIAKDRPVYENAVPG